MNEVDNLTIYEDDCNEGINEVDTNERTDRDEMTIELATSFLRRCG